MEPSGFRKTASHLFIRFKGKVPGTLSAFRIYGMDSVCVYACLETFCEYKILHFKIQFVTSFNHRMELREWNLVDFV